MSVLRTGMNILCTFRIFMYGYVTYVCVRVFACISMRTYVYIYIFAYVCMSIFVYEFVSMFIYFVCVSSWFGFFIYSPRRTVVVLFNP